MRLIIQLQEFENLVIKHVPNKYNQLADFLSRLEVRDKSQIELNTQIPEFEETVVPLASTSDTGNHDLSYLTSPLLVNTFQINTNMSRSIANSLPDE